MIFSDHFETAPFQSKRLHFSAPFCSLFALRFIPQGFRALSYSITNIFGPKGAWGAIGKPPHYVYSLHIGCSAGSSSSISGNLAEVSRK